MTQAPDGDRPEVQWDAYSPYPAPGYPNAGYPQPPVGYPQPPVGYPQPAPHLPPAHLRPGQQPPFPPYGPPAGGPGSPPVPYGFGQPLTYAFQYGPAIPRARREVRVIAIGLIVAGVIGAIGSIGQWVRVTAPSIYFDEKASGLEGGGALTVALCVTVAVMGGLLLQRTILGLCITALSCGGVTVLVALLNVASAHSDAHTLRVLYGIDVQISWGLWVTLLGGLLCTAGGLAALLRGRWLSPAA
jgi:hypothetical protein